LTGAAKTIIAEDNGALLRKHIAELEMERSTLQHAVDNGVKDYNLLMAGNESLLAERNDFCYHCEDLEKELTKVCSDAEQRTAALQLKIKSAEAHSLDVAAASQK
jgi:hypothetical protein